MPLRRPATIQPKRILVITLRYLGDTLLTTPLLHALRVAWPEAEIDVLLPAGNQGMLAGNPDVSSLIPLPAKGDAGGFLRLLAALYRRYDLAISTQAGDRPVLCAVLAGRRSLGFVDSRAGRWSWKRLLLNQALPFAARENHAVLENLRFCGALGIAPGYRMVPPVPEVAAPRIPVPYVVLHVLPQWPYKQWHDSGWIELAYHLQSNGYALVLTGSGGAEELRVLAALRRRLPPAVRNLAGRLTLPQLAELVGGAALFVGPDTGVTHLAAATGTPTLALFGPTDPHIWGPWPEGYSAAKSPFPVFGGRRQGNVLLLQQPMPEGCVPCQQEGCERHRHSRSACLDALPAAAVIAAAAELLAVGRRY